MQKQEMNYEPLNKYRNALDYSKLEELAKSLKRAGVSDYQVKVHLNDLEKSEKE